MDKNIADMIPSYIQAGKIVGQGQAEIGNRPGQPVRMIGIGINSCFYSFPVESMKMQLGKLGNTHVIKMP